MDQDCKSPIYSFDYSIHFSLANEFESSQYLINCQIPPAKTNSIRFYRKHESKSASQECDKWWMRLKVAQECTPNMSLGKMCYLHTCANNCESSFSRSASVNSLPILLLFGGLFVWPIHCECLAFHLLIWMTPQSGYFQWPEPISDRKTLLMLFTAKQEGFIFWTTIFGKGFVVKYKICV